MRRHYSSGLSAGSLIICITLILVMIASPVTAAISPETGAPISIRTLVPVAPVLVTTTATPPVAPPPQMATCQAPCECLSGSEAGAKWGETGFLSCASLPCGYTSAVTAAPVAKYCYKQKTVTTTTTSQIIRRNITLPTVTLTQTPVLFVTKTIPDDNDGIPFGANNCPFVANADQNDYDNDGIGDDCDNCMIAPNPDQKDSDGDRIGDACDLCMLLKDPSQNDNTDDMDAPGSVDTDGDRVGDRCDNCPKTKNPDQKDGDNDGVGDACDLCPAKPAPAYGKEEESSEYAYGDSDKDGVGSNCDNCLIKSNADQLDSDAQKQCSVQTANQGGGTICTITKTDGRGDACDNCPLVFNEDQKDTDKDGIGDACDNCLSVSNPDQKDSNKNNIGDACDCSDGIAGPSDYAPDKGISCPVITSCPHCNSKVKAIYLTDDPGKSIDIVFIPSSTSYSDQNAKKVSSTEYTKSEETFRAVATDAVTNWYWKLDTLSSEPLLPDYRERFNFYYYWDPLDTGDAMGSCSGVTPKNFWTNAPFTDVAAILYPPTWEKASDGFYYSYAGGCANKLGPVKSTFKAPGYVSHGAVVVHESGHAVFGLGDTYCGNTYYGYIDPKANVWPLKGWCETDAKNQGLSISNCRQISYDDPTTTTNPDCSKDFWKWDPDPDMMNQHFQGKFGPRGVGRINFIFNEYT